MKDLRALRDFTYVLSIDVTTNLVILPVDPSPRVSALVGAMTYAHPTAPLNFRADWFGNVLHFISPQLRPLFRSIGKRTTCPPILYSASMCFLSRRTTACFWA